MSKGAFIERGTILSASNDGYTVKSFDRDGIITPPIKPISTDTKYTVGDTVYFFLFRDGTGKILCAA